MNNIMKIRLERPEECRAVEILTREAFWNVYRPGCTEHFVLHCYRDNPDFIPELDFVMEEKDRLIGHVMFSKAELVLPDGTRKPSWTFGPIGTPVSRLLAALVSIITTFPRMIRFLSSWLRN